MKKTFLSCVAIIMACVFSVSVVAQTAPTLERLTADADEIYHFYLSQGVAVDKNPASPYYGYTYVTAATDGASDGASERTKTQKRGIHVYDAELNSLTPDNVGALPANAAALMTDASRQALHRVAVNPVNNHVVYCYNVEDASAIWSMDPANLTGDAVNLIEGLAITKANSFCFDAEGTLYVMDNANTATGGTIVKVVNGELVTVVQSKLWGVQDNSLVSDGRGGLWVAQHRWNIDTYSILTHVSAAGEVDFAVTVDSPAEVTALFTQVSNASYRGQCAYNVEKDILAFGGDKVVALFQVTYDEAGVPSLEKLTTTETIGSNIDGIDFYANGDLAVVSASSERFIKYAVTYPEVEEPQPEKAAVVKRAVQLGESTIVLSHEANGTAHIYQVVNGEIVAELSQEGVIAVDPENAGDMLAISDIAVTEDGKLLAINKVVCQAGDAQVDEGYKRGETRVYIWNDLAGAPSVWFTSKMSSNWYRSVQGHTMAYKGTSTNGTLVTTGVTATGVKFRYSVYNVIDGVYTDPEVNASEYYHFTKGDAQTTDVLGANYELNVSLLAENTWVLDGELVNPFEITDPLTYNTQVTAGATLTEDLGKKYNGASYVTVEDQVLMVAPFANPDGQLVGVEILNITNGFDAPQYVNMVYVDEAVAVEAAATAVQVVEGGLNITLVADNAIHTWFVELNAGGDWEVYEDEISNLVIDLDNLVLIGGPSSAFQVDVYLGLGEYNRNDDTYQLLPESSIAVMGSDATFIEGYAYEVDAFTPSAKAVVRCEWNGMKLEFHLTMTAEPMEATKVVVENAVVEIEKYLLWGDMYDYALKMTGEWVNPEDGLTYPVLVEVPVYYPEATEPSEIMSTVTVGGWGDNDPWLGFGEGTLTVTTVDGVVTATGIVQNPMAGVAIDITISGKIVETALENLQVTVKPVKAIKNGQLIITKDGKEYNAQGATVK